PTRAASNRNGGRDQIGMGGRHRRNPHALADREAGLAGPRFYSGPDDDRFQRLRASMEQDWTPGMARILEIEPADLPVIWDADFLLGPKTPAGDDSYVLCEINVSSVFPIPDETADALAETLLHRLEVGRSCTMYR
ncbi:MAG: hypothetical protein Q8R44_12915, partial [Novosphingobium sp.]|nr:hypothetical protein [Novosphingobium sp.]